MTQNKKLFLKSFEKNKISLIYNSMLQSFTCKYRLYPTKEQQVLLAKHFGCVRLLYNKFLDKSIQSYKENGKSSTFCQNCKELPILKKELPYLTEVNSQSLQHSLKQLSDAYDNFFRNVINKKSGKKGFPKFKSKYDKQSFRVKQSIHLLDNELWIPKFKKGIKVIIHRKLEGKICYATISKNKANQYFVSITCEVNVDKKERLTKVVGLDLNVKYIVASDGQKYENPATNKQKEQKLAQGVSRKQVGSTRRSKAQLKLNKYKQKQINIREDFQHKVSKKLIDENQVIVLESLDVKSMLKNVNPTKRKNPRWKEKLLHRSLNFACFASFVEKLTYKAKWYGRDIIKIDKWFPSSQLCSNCGYQNTQLGEEKIWKCQNCYTTHDRDENASINILNEGTKNNRWNDGDSQGNSYISQEEFLLALS